jgi:hypothetical protein
MNLFKKLFRPQKTPSEVGYELWEKCVAVTNVHLVVLCQDLRNELGITLDEEKAITEEKELLMVNLWAITKSLSGGKDDEVIRCMHDNYFNSHNEINRQSVQKELLSRYDKYESLFDHEKGQHVLLASQIMANMYNKGKLDTKHFNALLWLSIVESFSNVMVMALNHIANVKIKS